MARTCDMEDCENNCGGAKHDHPTKDKQVDLCSTCKKMLAAFE